MANASYVGVNGVARKISKKYVGVDGVARKISKGYAGVDGVARKFFTTASPLSGTLSSMSVSGLGFTPNFCAYYFSGSGTGGHSSYSAVASAISTNTSGSLAGWANITISEMSAKTQTATFGNGTLSVPNMSSTINPKSVVGICGYASNVVFGSFSANNNSFTQTISTDFTPNFVAICCPTIGTGGNSGYYFTLCGWTPSIGSTSTSGGNFKVSVSYSTSGVTLTANYQANHRFGTVRYIVARI